MGNLPSAPTIAWRYCYCNSTTPLPLSSFTEATLVECTEASLYNSLFLCVSHTYTIVNARALPIPSPLCSAVHPFPPPLLCCDYK